MSNYIKDGVLYNELDRPVCPTNCPTHPTDKQVAAYQAYVKQVVADYKASLVCSTPEQKAERAFELRAAFGPGQRVVNILTGEEIIT